MAARKNLTHPQVVRDRIRTSQLVNRLEKFVLGEKEQGADVSLTPAQVQAALGLIRKRLPDLAAVEHNGEIAQRHYVAELPLQQITGGEWLRLQNESLSGDPNPAHSLPS